MALRSTTFALASLLGALVWPWVVGALANLLMSPLERATRGAWCGMPFHSGFEMLGHCAACWTGSALFAAIAVLLFSRGGVASDHARA